MLILLLTDLEALQDNDTRWSSHYTQIERALRIRKRIEIFCYQYRKEIDQDTLSDEDWDQLSDIRAALEPFKAATKSLQSNATDGRHGSVWEWLPTIEYLINHTANGQVQSTEKYGLTHPQTICWQNSWQKLDKWWHITDQAFTVYAAATLLAPRCRKAYFDKNWKDESFNDLKERMIKKVHQYWLDNYAETTTTINKQSATVDDHRTPLDIQIGDIDERVKVHDDPFLDFISSSTTTTTDVLNWWSEFGPPELRQMAFDILSIPAMSAEVERIFSSAKRALTPDRNALTVESLEVYELLRNWWRGDIVLQMSDAQEEEAD